MFGIDFKLGEAFSRLLVLMSRLLSLLGRVISNTGLGKAPSSCLVGVLVVITVKSSVLLEMMLLAIVGPRLLVSGTKWSALVSAKFVALSSVELLVASPGLGCVKFPGMVLLVLLLSGWVSWTSVFLVMLSLAVSGPRLLVCGFKFLTLVSVTLVTLSSVEPLVPLLRLGWVPFPGVTLIGVLLSGRVPWTVTGGLGAVAVFACAGTCVGGPGGLVACCAVVGFRCDLTFSRASVHSLLIGGTFEVALVLVFWFVVLVVVLLALGLLA